MIISSNNEWGKLRSVVVGTATNANFPIWDNLFQIQMSQAGWNKSPPPSGKVPQWIVDETNEDLQILADTLTSLGIGVHRPDEDYLHVIQKQTQDWITDGQYSYCPRDNFLVVGGQVIEAPMSTRARITENQAFTNIKRSAMINGAKWYSAPQPRLLMNENVIDGKFKLTELEPVFDAANVLRMGKDLLYLISSSGNRAGAMWLQIMLGDNYQVHVTDCYDAAHIDSTIVPISADTVVLNGDRVNEDNLPALFKDWNKIYINGDMIVPQDFIGYPYASKWMAINMLALGDNKVICDKNQPRIIEALEIFNFEVIPLELRHSRTLGGGFHCVTLDLHRDIE